MLDKIFEILQAIFHSLLPWVVLQPYENGALCRLGIFRRVLGPGFHFVFPFGIDMVWQEHVTPRTDHLAGLSTTTKDGKSIGFDAIVTWQVSDIKKAVLEVTQVKDAIADTCTGIIGTALSESTWEDILHGKTVDGLTKLCRSRGWRWGIEIMQVQLSGVCSVKNIRISSPHSHIDVSHGSGE